MSDRKDLLIVVAVLVGSTMGGVIYHALTCRACRGAKAAPEQVAHESPG